VVILVQLVEESPEKIGGHSLSVKDHSVKIPEKKECANI